MRMDRSDPMFRQMLQLGGRQLIAQKEVQIKTLRDEQDAIRKALGGMSNSNPEPRRPSKGEASGMIARFRKQQGQHGNAVKPELSPGRKRHAELMRKYHRDPEWRKKHGLPPPRQK